MILKSIFVLLMSGTCSQGMNLRHTGGPDSYKFESETYRKGLDRNALESNSRPSRSEANDSGSNKSPIEFDADTSDSSPYYTPDADQLLWNPIVPLLNGIRVFDGPLSISTAPVPTENRNKLPTVEQMNYYMYYAAATYYGYDHEDLSCEYCLKFRDDLDDHKVIVNNFHNTLALVTLSKKRQEIVVAFRGSHNVWNIILDSVFTATGDYVDGIKMHYGFTVATESLYDDVVGAISSYLDEQPDLKVVVTGHSLGADMARITYFFLEDREQFPSVVYELYTYGESRVGNKAFADFMNRQPITTARVVARADYFVHVPPTSFFGTKLLLGDYFVHPQTEYWINGKEHQQFCNRTVYEDPECSMSMGPIYTVVDHLVYFDVNFGNTIGQPLQFLQVPFGIFNPYDTLPPFPKFFENIVGGAGLISLGAISPYFG